MNEKDIELYYGSDATKLTVVLEKKPECGLGLILVDGSVNGINGVYIKSVSEDGQKKVIKNFIFNLKFLGFKNCRLFIEHKFKKLI